MPDSERIYRIDRLEQLAEYHRVRSIDHELTIERRTVHSALYQHTRTLLDIERGCHRLAAQESVADTA